MSSFYKQYVPERNIFFLLFGDRDAQWVRRWYNQAHGGYQHIQSPGADHMPLTALAFVLQDGLITLMDHFL